MGSATLYHLAKEGYKVLGLDRFELGHQKGSSHGLSRIFRMVYREGAEYVPPLKRAHELWNDLNEESSVKILKKTGSLDAGNHFLDALWCAETQHLDHQVLTGLEVNKMFPGFGLPDDWKAVYSPEGMVLYPEKCIAAHLNAAQVTGNAHILHKTGVMSWAVLPDGTVEVETESQKFQTKRLVLSVGPWIEKFVPEMQGLGLCVPERQVVGWYESEGNVYSDAHFPVFVITDETGDYYGFPKTDEQDFKIGKFRHRREVTSPDNIDIKLHDEDDQVLQVPLKRYFPQVVGKLRSFGTCMFTNTPDGHFLIDRHPAFEQVIICSPCSGHGFKFASVVGELVSDIAMQGESLYNFGIHSINDDRPKHAQFIKKCQRIKFELGSASQKYQVIV
eukprot:TRINITY_DN12610_c0_g1_i1.p1 TRINITY_DN12610_c0_g1~~TRINITY_DN12610_c0_g1_i1.p1  ORF type:complete len:390 (-),score=30.72 TRINITY_DN12610_c0_g1_i1:197-1366(-)